VTNDDKISMGLTLANVTEVQANLLKSTITLAKKSLIRK
jgi:hypothetical protein